MRYLTLMMLAGFVVTAATAQAQDASRGEKAAAMLQQKFEAADADHDGKLSPEEAKAGMPRVSEHFSETDTDKDGYVSRAEIISAMQAMKAKRDADKQ